MTALSLRSDRPVSNARAEVVHAKKATVEGARGPTVLYDRRRRAEGRRLGEEAQQGRGGWCAIVPAQGLTGKVTKHAAESKNLTDQLAMRVKSLSRLNSLELNVKAQRAEITGACRTALARS